VFTGPKELMKEVEVTDHVDFRSATIEEFQEQLLSRLPDLQFVGTYHTKNSEVFEYTRRGSPDGRPVLVKWKRRCVPTETSAAAAIREFSALETVWKRSGWALDGSIPRPIALLPELGAFVTEKLPGESLRGILRREGNLLVGPFRRKRLGQIGWLTGKWARKFHDATLGKPQAHDSQQFLTKVRSWVEQCSDGGMEAPATEEIWELSAKLSQKMEGAFAAAAASHGDFNPGNILVEGDQIAVVDFEDFRDCDVVYEDLGMMNAYLGLLKLSFDYCGPAIAEMMRFLEGYGNRENRELLPLYTVRAALNIMAFQLRNPEGGRMSARKLRLQQHRVLTMARMLLA
jgi:Phosphotransferase enzyme family